MHSPSRDAFAIISGLLILIVCETRVPGDELRFNRDIRPILTAHCFACHGADEDSREAELRLDQRELAIEKAAIVPESPGESELLRRIFSQDPDESMPPAGQAPLSTTQKETLKQWVLDGAKYESHWAFIPPQRPAVPIADSQHTSWPNNPIDHFVLKQLIAESLTPSPEASRHTLVRRLYLDLIGLPPTMQEIRAFVNDDSKAAYEKLVDRLLSSKHFGEHWARMWLDLARYADTKGYEKDNHRDIWRYRDWVIAAFNADMPYAQFTTEQLAGDLLSDATTDQLIATAFHRNTMTNDEGGTDDEEFRTLAVNDRIDTTMQIWMGLTMGCAKCHSHKYDPISQDEYYQFFAFFNQTEDADRGDEQPKIETPTDEQATRLAALQHEIDLATKQRQALSEGDAEIAKHGERLKELKKQFAEAEKAASTTPIMRELAAEKRRKTHVHIRGNFLDPGEEVTAATPQAFGSFPSDSPQNRLGVAKWLLQAENPLTYRVAVNRVWARIFGIGLVETEEDFGTQGTYPSHPDLLDWLAIEFRDASHGSHKQLCKQIVMSATYRQSSVVRDEARDIDPRNRLLSYAPRVRLSAEAVRDQALVAAGLLSRDVGGPSVMPPQPDGIWRTTYNSAKWINAKGDQRYRRGLYTYWRRTSPYPSMTTFDAGSREVCLVRRIRTNIPLQALVTLNDTVFVEACGALAQAVLSTDLSLEEQRVAYAFQRVLIRPPSADEIRRLADILNDALVEFESDPEAATELIAAAGVEAGALDKVQLAAWTVVANVLFNLDETIMRN